jgi:hypothetical protein
MAYLHPTDELVAVAWLKTITGLHEMVATETPDDTSTWQEYGFVTVEGAGGTPHVYLPVHRPVLGLDFWAVNPSSVRPPWGKANQLFEVVRAATLPGGGYLPAAITSLPADYNHAVVTEARVVIHARRIPEDEQGWAHYQADLELHWKEISR